MFDLSILYEDNHLLVINKPNGLATMGLPEGEETLLTRAKEYIKEKYDKKGNVYLGVVSRLDVPVSGVLVFARTSKAADRLNEQFRTHKAEKIYHGIVQGAITPQEGNCINWICEDPRHRKVWITRDIKNPDAREARLHYRLLKRISDNSLLEIQLETGRKHQIRVQLSHLGYPILGDRKYGAIPISEEGICLHARRLSLVHPTLGTPIVFEAPYPDFWNHYTVRNH